MFGAELAYVRAQLARLDSAGKKAVAKAIGRNVKTIERIADKRTKFGRTDTIGKLLLHFRTKEKRA